MQTEMNHYFLCYVRWSVMLNCEEFLEFLATAHTAADAKVFCDVAAAQDTLRSKGSLRAWSHDVMQASSEEAYRCADSRDGWDLSPFSDRYQVKSRRRPRM